jgi:hypothetical protein
MPTPVDAILTDVSAAKPSLRLGRVALAALDIAFMTVVIALVFRDFLFDGGSLIIPIDGTHALYPLEHYFAGQLRAGELPLWMPHQMSGFPLIGYPQYGLFYPVHWLFWLWPGEAQFSPTTFGAQTVFHCWLMAVGMYALVAQLGWHRAGGVAAGLTWAVAPNTLVFVGWANALAGFVWWPFALLFMVRAEQRGFQGWGDVCLAGLFLGLSVLAAPAQPAIQLIGLIALLFLFRTDWTGWTWRALLPIVQSPGWKWRSLAPRARPYAVGILIGLRLGAVSLVPIIEYSLASIRFIGAFGAVGTMQRMRIAAFTHEHFGLWQLPGLVLRSLSHQEFAFDNYVGPFIFCAAAFGIVAAWRGRDRFALWAGFVLILSILYMFNIGLPYLFYWIPGLNMIREPAYYASYLLFSAALLAAYGIDQVVRRRMTRADLTLAAGSAIAVLALLALVAWAWGGPTALVQREVVLLVVAAAWAVGFGFIPRGMGMVALALVFCGLVGWGFAAPDAPFAWNYPAARVHAYEQSLAASRKLETLAPPPGDPQRVFFYRAGESLTAPTWNPNIAMLTGFYDVFGYVNPTLKVPFQAFSSARKHSRMLTLLDVRTIATDPSTAPEVAAAYGLDPSAATVATSIPMTDSAYNATLTDAILFRYDKGKGHAWLSTKYEVIRPRSLSRGLPLELQPELVRVREPGFDLSGTVILDRAPDPAIDQSAPPQAGRISWLDYQPNRMALQVTTDRPAMLTVSEMFYPGWRARVNGAPAHVYRAYGFLRAVEVPAGTSTVTFDYIPASLLIGFLLSAAALTAAVLLPLSSRRKS